MADIWSEALHGIEPRLDRQTFDMWHRPIQLTDVDGDLLRLRAPNRFLKEWFETHYLECVLDELASGEPGQFELIASLFSIKFPNNKMTDFIRFLLFILLLTRSALLCRSI